jgi:integrase
VIRPQYRVLGFVGAYGGLRFGELAGLRRSRLDLDASTGAGRPPAGAGPAD